MSTKEGQQSYRLVDDAKCSELLQNLRRSVDQWFLMQQDEESKRPLDDTVICEEIQSSCLDILLHGLATTRPKECSSYKENFTTTTHCNDAGSSSSELRKLIDDFEWVSCSGSVEMRLNSVQQQVDTTDILVDRFLNVPAKQSPVQRYLCDWLARNLHSGRLCACLQALLAENELLELHYKEGALVRREKYAIAFLMAISALETQQYGLLSQMDSVLAASSSMRLSTQCKRANSQPNMIILPPKQLIHQHSVQIGANSVQRCTGTSSITSSRAQSKGQDCVVQVHANPHKFISFRKTKSLPTLLYNMKKEEEENDHSPTKSSCGQRPRCKTISGGITTITTRPQDIPTTTQRPQTNISHEVAGTSHTTNCSSSCSSYGCVEYYTPQPSTSTSTSTSTATSSSRKSQTSNFTLNSIESTASISGSLSSTNSTTTARRIELIKCDDIKIWTDQSQSEELQHKVTTPCDIPAIEQRNSVRKQAQSLSPINSFLSLFNTSPSHTSWFSNRSYCDDEPQQWPELDTTTTLDVVNSKVAQYQQQAQAQAQAPSSTVGSVFDSFLPIYGKKLRSRNSQSLFEDSAIALDYSTLVSSKPASSEALAAANQATQRNCQSLTTFLQMSQLSRHNTELEKENAHFRISEAIISAIEHIKWSKIEPDNKKRCHKDKDTTTVSTIATATATDCLAPAERRKDDNCIDASASTNGLIAEEQTPYAELGEVCADFLSAEVVGLSLIAKFDEEHLPKVSELKWLVSEEDTPQKLLPMPDASSSSANPDDNVVPSVTRGTKYWAPPRQQIIFTDHPPPNRKELLQKQNYRCAGCGMRVSQQYVHSFRYCTYLGKYHCTGCHRNQISAIPAKILQMWDFKCYPVSVFAYRLLEQMFTYPLFYVPDLNPALYVKSKALFGARRKRVQLYFVKDFIRMCRFAVREQTYFECVPDYITNDIDMWSLSDFIDVQRKCLQHSIDELIAKCENHIFNCVLCTARGFICEYCRAYAVIYPWSDRTVRCDRCGSCFHRNCWKSMSETCCRCQRIDKRHHITDDI